MVTKGKLQKMRDLSRRKQETWDMENAEAKNYFFASVFSGMSSSHITHITEDKGRDWQNEELPAINKAGGYLRNLKVAQVHGTC